MMKLRLSWTDPVSQRPRRPLLNAPIALGRAFETMPSEITGQSVSRMVIGDRQIHDFQALLVEIEGELYLIDNGGQSEQGGQTYVNQQPISGQERLSHGDRIRIGHTELQLQILDAPPGNPSQHSTHLQVVPDPVIEPSHGTDHATGYSGNGNGTSPALNGTPQSDLPPPPVPHQPPLNPQPPFIPQQNGHLPEANGHCSSNGIVSPTTVSPATHQSQPSNPAPVGPAPIPGSAATAQPLQLPPPSPNAGCRRMVGFLFKRPCGRTNSAGCDHCANGYSSHAYRSDYDLYEGFGRFEPGDWGYGLLENQAKG